MAVLQVHTSAPGHHIHRNTYCTQLSDPSTSINKSEARPGYGTIAFLFEIFRGRTRLLQALQGGFRGLRAALPLVLRGGRTHPGGAAGHLRRGQVQPLEALPVVEHPSQEGVSADLSARVWDPHMTGPTLGERMCTLLRIAGIRGYILQICPT